MPDLTDTDPEQPENDGAEPTAAPFDVIVVTGPAGAGRSTAIKALEDLGFEAIDNLPLSLTGRLLDGRALSRPLALGIDPRTRDFSVIALRDAITRAAGHAAYSVQLVYLDCRADVLLRRFSETRRRHPSAGGDADPARAVELDRSLLAPLQGHADVTIDTSEMSPHDLRAAIDSRFARSGEGEMRVSIRSFSYKRGLPQDLDCVLDVRFLRNPHWSQALRDKDGRAQEVAEYVAADPAFDPFFGKVRDLLLFLLPAYRDEGKAHLSVGFGCTGGRHRSVALAESTSRTLAEAGWRVTVRHQELERAGDGARAALGGAS